MKLRWLLLVPAGFGVLSLTADAADWPQWRGPRRNGISQESGLLKEWPKDGPKLLWQNADIGDGYATPAVAGARLYLLSNRGMENELVQALSVQDGKPVHILAEVRVMRQDVERIPHAAFRVHGVTQLLRHQER